MTVECDESVAAIEERLGQLERALEELRGQ
jgi:hypothetical protein